MSHNASPRTDVVPMPCRTADRAGHGPGAPAPSRGVHSRAVTRDRSLSSVAVEQVAIHLPLADVDLETLYLTLGYERGSGQVVAAALDVGPRSPLEILRLFGRSGADAAGSGRSGVAWTCPGLPREIVLDHAATACARDLIRAARELGIRIVHRGRHDPREAMPARDLGRHLAHYAGSGGGAQVHATMGALVGVMSAWLAGNGGCGRGDRTIPLA